MCAELAGVALRVIDVERMGAVVERRGARFLERVFTPAERAYAAGRGPEPLAVRFAAKCAGRELLRRNGKRVTLRELEVVRRATGEPSLRAPDGLRFMVSLAHEPALALASVWLERESGAEAR